MVDASNLTNSRSDHNLKMNNRSKQASNPPVCSKHPAIVDDMICYISMLEQTEFEELL